MFKDFKVFLQETAPHKVAEAMQTIFEKIDMLLTFPKLGHPIPNEKLPNLRQLTIKWGKYGYVALYSYEEDKNLIIMETIRHARELEPNL
ncbi:type II toxin-antitoxin system RelE/ParE family toxin [Moraxella sp. ZY210820]|uniref:type II toxin-antitoxin system RelE/ParE family toxin n=1 Tax=unclassified Moraxella TaxID=2685852 RepID=UPI00351E6DCD